MFSSKGMWCLSVPFDGWLVGGQWVGKRWAYGGFSMGQKILVCVIFSQNQHSLGLEISSGRVKLHSSGSYLFCHFKKRRRDLMAKWWIFRGLLVEIEN